MAVGNNPGPSGDSAESLGLWRLSLTQYHAMAHAGILEDGAPIELLEGLLVAKVTKSPAHELTKHALPAALALLLPPGWSIRREAPLALADSEPEPDVVVVRGDVRDHAERHPGPGDAALVVEIADASLQRDRTVKQRVYARAGIPEYWIVDLRSRCVEVFTQPSDPSEAPRYAERRVVGEQDALPVRVGEREVGRLGVRGVLP